MSRTGIVEGERVRRPESLLACLLTAVVMAGGLAAVNAAPAAAGQSNLTLDKSAPAQALLGDNIPYTLTASNSSASPMYNASFSDVLPEGMRYVNGSAGADIGEPQKSTLDSGQQLLIWSNIADLQANSTLTIAFTAAYDPLPLTISPTDTNTATVATDSDPRMVPKFDSDGNVDLATYQASDSVTTQRVAFEVEKDEPSPENELLRGAHDQRTVYTLKVRNNKATPTTGVTVSDFLPASLEFLGCGDTDNTAPNTEVEYPGAPRLGVPAYSPAPSPCPTPVEVETIDNPVIPGHGPEAGTFTKVTWNLGDFGPGQVKTIKYVAGIPLNANTTSWPGQTPTPASLSQGSNLDNNTGASTREGATESTATNFLSGTGTFLGLPGPTETTSTTSHTVSIEDLRLLKSMSPGTFVPGNVATVTLKVDTSEYMNGSNITITDTLPDGFCPLGTQNYMPGAPADCAPTGSQPSTAYDSVVANADGTFTITFTGLSVNADGSTTVTFPARMRAEYSGTTLSGIPTVAGDRFTNTAELSGTTTPTAGVDGIETGAQTVNDASKASQDTNLPAIDKTMKPRYLGIDCEDLVNQPYRDYNQLSPAQRTFRLGDTVCFKVRVDFPNISTRNAVVTDFIPPDTEYIDGSFATTANNTATIATSDLTGNPLTWTLGTDNGGDYFVEPDAVFEAVIALRVLKPSGAPAPDLTGNLMKMRTENTAGDGESYRDLADFEIAPPPDLEIVKGVAETTLPAATFETPADNKPVQQGATATFQVDVTNRPRPEYPGTDFSSRSLQVWDVLPDQLRCNAVSNFQFIEPGTTTLLPLNEYVECIDPPVNGQSAASYLKWTFPGPSTNKYTVFAGETLSLLYDLKIPDEVSVSTKFNNTAYVRSFQSYTDVPGVPATYLPENNIDASIASTDWNAQQLEDPASVYVPNATVGKSAVTSVTDTNNNLTTQATIGESVTYTYSVTVPANSTVYNGVLSDTLPVGIELLAIEDWGLDGFTNKPAGFIIDGATGALTFPNTYINNTASPQVFAVKVLAQVTGDAATCADPCPVPPSPATNVAKVNTAKFSSRETLDGTKLPDRVRNYTINIVQPNPTITKIAKPKNLVGANDVVQYTVTVSNPTGRPPLYNASVIDCLPAPMDLGNFTATAGSVVRVGTPQCANVGMVWTIGEIAPGTSATLSYPGNLVGTVPGNTKYTNDAVLTGTSMPGTVDGERTYTSTGSASILTPSLGLAKNTSPSTVTIGQSFTSEISLTLKGNTTYYDPALVDQLPIGVDPASVSNVQVTCTVAPGPGECDPPEATRLAENLPQKIGWSFGELLSGPDSDAQDYVITISYSATVDDVNSNIAGTTLTNSATAYSNNSELIVPTSVSGAEAMQNKTGPVSDTVTVVEPDLDLTKTVDDTHVITAVPGQVFTYAITVTNGDGANVSTAYDVTVSDTLPAGIEVVGTPSDNGVINGNVITWTLDSLDRGGSKTFTYTARLKPPATGLQQNTAGIDSYYSLDGDQGREYSGPDDTADVSPVLPEVAITKYPGADLAYIDQAFTWSLEIQNSTGATAYALGAKDKLPTNWAYVPGSAKIIVDGVPSAVEPGIKGGILTWSGLGDLPAGASASIEYQAKPTSAVLTNPGIGLDPPVPQTNVASAAWNDGPPGESWPGHTTGEVAADTFIANADLGLTKSHVTDYDPPVATDEVVPGTEFQWKMVVTNNGPDPSAGPFTVTDTLPAGTTYKNASGDGWSCTAAAQVVTCTNGTETLLDGESLPALLLTVEVAPEVTGDLENTATVSGPTYDPDPANNTDEDTVTTRPLADVGITKTGTTPYRVGDTVTYTLAVTNSGPSTSAAPITVVDTLPAGVSITSIDSGSWKCSPTSGAAATLTCTLDKALQPTSQADLIKVTVEVLDSPGLEAVNTAVVTPTTEDPDEENNTSSVTDPVEGEVQLGISKRTTGPNPVPAGDTTQFTITVTNDGPAKAKNVQVVDDLDPGLTAVSATGDGWTCDVGSGSQVTCQRTDFKVSQSPSDIVVTARVASSVPNGSTLSNIARVTTTSPQPGGDPEPAESTVDVITRSDLSIVKTHTKKRWVLNDSGRWDVTVTNDGPSDNVGPITVTDTLPAGTRLISASGAGWACEGTSTVTCALTDGLIAGQSSQIAVTVEVVQGAIPAVTNTASVTSPVEDPTPANNSTDDRVPVDKAKQTATKIKPKQRVFPVTRTEQGQRIRTTVRCLPVRRGAAGEVSYCRVTRSKNGTVRVRVLGAKRVRVIVTQTAKGTAIYRPFKRVTRYVLRP